MMPFGYNSKGGRWEVETPPKKGLSRSTSLCINEI